MPWPAGVYGLIVLLPIYFMVDEIGRMSSPISHLEYSYGFTGVAITWQFFFVIAADVERYRLAMLPEILEKLDSAFRRCWLSNVVYRVCLSSLPSLTSDSLPLLLPASRRHVAPNDNRTWAELDRA